MNSVSIVGRLTRDPELRHTNSGTAVCTIRLAVDRAGDKDDDGTIKAGFFDVELWDKKAELAEQYLTKGRQVAITGRLRLHEWEAKDGGKRSQVGIVAFDMTFIGSRDDGDSDGQQRTSRQRDDNGGDFGSTDADFQSADDDIPF